MSGGNPRPSGCTASDRPHSLHVWVGSGIPGLLTSARLTHIYPQPVRVEVQFADGNAAEADAAHHQAVRAQRTPVRLAAAQAVRWLRQAFAHTAAPVVPSAHASSGSPEYAPTSSLPTGESPLPSLQPGRTHRTCP